MNFIARWLVSAASIYISAYLMEGIHVTGFKATLIAAAVLGIVNTLVKPILLFFTLPLNIATLGLFTFVVNGIAFYLAASLTSGIEIRGMLDAIVGAILISIVNMILSGILGVKK